MKKEDLLRIEQEEHKKFHRRIIYVFVVMMIMLFGGATFYYYVEGFRYIDALYLSAATMTTVGYGDITPQTDFGKLFTVAYVFFGVGIALYGLSVIATHFVEVREEFWLERLGKIRIRHRTGTLWEKIKNAFNYKPDLIVGEYENSVSAKKKSK
ncbi:two pore domain potassium channel family protein [Candidatus Woesearchaeota archaeon]|nr:two pore domain potassium channel family protein [Candidatus Woesearchaeota archaeon]